MNELLLDKHLLFSFVFGFYLLIILFIVIYVYSWLVSVFLLFMITR